MRRIAMRCAPLLVAAGLVGCSTPTSDHLATDAPRAQLFEELGSHARTITTDTPDAQVYFNQGLNWMYAFNHDEAIRSFAKAAELDPECAMAWWGIALCEGPNYNDPLMTPQRNSAAWAALQEAKLRIDNTSPAERALIEALSARYAWPAPTDRSHLEQAYADAMAAVWAAYPNDSDIGTLYAEAMMVQRPWKLYSIEREPEGDTEVIVATLERVMEMDPGNPGANHLYIHAVEPSTTPERGVAAANRLSGQVPGAGHLDHMPSHIYVQVGMWDESIAQNAIAMEADDDYLELSPDQTIQHMYMVHNAHMLAFSAMMVGRESEAMYAARDMWAHIPEEMMAAVAPYIDLWMTSIYDVQKRFGRWNDIIAEPAPPEYFPITTAVWRAHRAIAYAAMKDFENAEREYEAFQEARAAIPEDSVWGDDPSDRILEVSDYFIRGEIALQQEDWERAIELLEESARVEDTLSYGEPPVWLQPVRHTLGAVYLKAGRDADAERVYRQDLEKWENNGWSLFGLSQALAAQGRTDEASEVMGLHAAAWSKADEPTTTSCVCIPDTE